MGKRPSIKTEPIPGIGIDGKRHRRMKSYQKRTPVRRPPMPNCPVCVSERAQAIDEQRRSGIKASRVTKPRVNKVTTDAFGRPTDSCARHKDAAARDRLANMERIAPGKRDHLSVIEGGEG
jgi:hypothetical protein